MLEEKVFNGRGNTIEIALYVGSSILTHTTITRAQLKIGSTTLDSNTPAEAAFFDFTEEDRIILKLGAAGLTAGPQVARLIIFDATFTTGVVWGDIMLLVYD